MDIGTILFYKDYFYIVKDIGNDKLDLIGEFSEISINLSDLNKENSLVIPQFYIDDLFDKKTFLSFTKPTLARGKEYHVKGRVESFYIDDEKLFARVYGTEEYNVELSFYSLPSCDCPVGYYCKHIVACYFRLKDIFYLLEEKYKTYNYVAEEDYSIDLDTGVVKNETDLKSRNIDFENFFNFTPEDYVGNYPARQSLKYNAKLARLTRDEKKEFLEKIEARSRFSYDALSRYYLIVFYLDKSLFEFADILTKDSNYPYAKRKFNSYKIELENSMNQFRYEDSKENRLLYLYLNHMNKEILEFYLAHLMGKEKFKFYIEEALKALDKDEINQILSNYNFFSRSTSYNFKVFVPYLNEENYKALIKISPQLILEDSNFDLGLTPEYLLSLGACLYGENMYKFAVKFKDILSLIPKDFAHYLVKAYDACNTNTKKNEIIKIAKSLPHSKYFVLAKFSGYYTYYYKKRLFDYNFDEASLKNILKEVNEDDMFAYFSLEFEVNERYNKAVLYSTLSFGRDILASVEIQDDVIDFEIITELSDTKICEFMYAYLMTTRKAEIDNLFQQVNENIKQRLYEESLEKLNNSIEIFSRDALQTLGASYNTKATLEVEILLSTNNRLGFSLKISHVDNSRFYKVKSLVKFVKSFYNKETISYGKNLTFMHSTDYLVEPYNKLVEYLMQIYYFGDYSNDDIKLNESNYDSIFKILGDTYIKFNGIDTRINLDPLKVEYFVDENYILKTNIESENRFIKLTNTYYVYSKKINELRLLDISVKEKPLFDLFSTYQGTSIEPLKEKFRDVVYSMYADKISVNENKKEDFKINNIDIEAYFDYQNGIISVETKYAKDGNEILDVSQIVGADVSKVNTYNNYLMTIGFNDGKIEDEDNILNFFELDFEYLRILANVYLSDKISNKYVKTIGKTIINIEKKNNMFEAFLASSDYSDEELILILKAIKKKKKFILLNNDQIVKLDDEAKEFYNTLEDLNIDINHPSKPINLPTYQALKAYAHEKNCKIDEYLSELVNDIKNYKDFEVEVPSVNATLRSYQIEGFKWLSILKKYHIGGILADDMGLGKTLEIITLLCADDTKKPSLIVCPKSLVFNWKNEFEKFAPEVEVSEIYGTIDERLKTEENIENNKRHVYIISYDSLGRDIDTLSKYDYGFVILDEAQAIKNVYAKKSENVKSLKAEYRYALTGTPIENTVIDLWSLFDFLMPEYFEELSTFKSKYMHDDAYTQVIAKKVAPFILRRTKKDVLKDLPAKYERIVTCEMNEEQRKYYDAHILEANEKMRLGAKAFDILPYLMRLRQLCIDPGLFIENSKESGAKLEELYKIIDEYKTEHKMLIFSQFVSALNKVENHLKQKKIPYYMITGQTDAKERLEMSNKFNNDKAPVFLVSLKAGGTGLNLIGADTVIHLDPWWNNSAENQATDRAYRIGQTKNVEVIKLITANSIEQRVIELQNLKKDIIDKLIASDDNRITKVTLEDLAFILK